MKPTTVISFLGSTLDASKFGPSRWMKWRPSVGLCMHEDLRVDRFLMIHGSAHSRLAEYVSEDIASVSPETMVERHVIDFADAWDFEEVYGKLLDFARSQPLDPDVEDYLIHITTGTHVAQICLFLLTEAHYLPGRLLQTQPKRGAPDAVGTWSVIDLDLSRYDSIATRFASESAESTSFLKSGIETRNAAFNTMIDEIEQVASRTRAPILLMGPTGAGKSQLARRIFELKKLKRQVNGQFVEVNCATLRGDSAMSALFGHKKGAFTGAAADRPGLLRTADGGMLFLDEIGELGLDEQAMILRAIEDKRFLPVGADREAESDFQLIAGTNRDLAQCVADGTFREDLYASTSGPSRCQASLSAARTLRQTSTTSSIATPSAKVSGSRSTRRRAIATWLSRCQAKRCGQAIFATWPPASPAWQPFPPRAASTVMSWRARSRG
jgi:transcriptional regulatory protein RtcR